MPIFAFATVTVIGVASIRPGCLMIGSTRFAVLALPAARLACRADLLHILYCSWTVSIRLDGLGVAAGAMGLRCQLRQLSALQQLRGCLAGCGGEPGNSARMALTGGCPDREWQAGAHRHYGDRRRRVRFIWPGRKIGHSRTRHRDCATGCWRRVSGSIDGPCNFAMP